MKKYYKLNFYKKYIPEDNINKNKLFYDLILYFELNNIIIRYKKFIINNQNEFKKINFL